MTIRLHPTKATYASYFGSISLPEWSGASWQRAQWVAGNEDHPWSPAMVSQYFSADPQQLLNVNFRFDADGLTCERIMAHGYMAIYRAHPFDSASQTTLIHFRDLDSPRDFNKNRLQIPTEEVIDGLTGIGICVPPLGNDRHESIIGRVHPTFTFRPARPSRLGLPVTGALGTLVPREISLKDATARVCALYSDLIDKIAAIDDLYPEERLDVLRHVGTHPDVKAILGTVADSLASIDRVGNIAPEDGASPMEETE